MQRKDKCKQACEKYIFIHHFPGQNLFRKKKDILSKDVLSVEREREGKVAGLQFSRQA